MFPITCPLFNDEIAPYPPRQRSTVFSSAFSPGFDRPRVFPLGCQGVSLFLRSQVISVWNVRFRRDLFQAQVYEGRVLFEGDPRVFDRRVDATDYRFRWFYFSNHVVVICTYFRRRANIMCVILPARRSSPLSPLVINFRRLDMDVSVPIEFEHLYRDGPVSVSIRPFFRDHVQLPYRRIYRSASDLMGGPVRPKDSYVPSSVTFAFHRAVRIFRHVARFSQVLRVLSFGLVRGVICHCFLPGVRFKFPRYVFCFRLICFQGPGAKTPFVEQPYHRASNYDRYG